MSTLSRRTGAAALARASFASTSRSCAARRTIVSIPNPELVSATGSTDFAVRTLDRMPNMTYAFAIVRAIEAKYGVVLNLEVHKDADTMRPANRMFVTFLKPVELEAGERIYEIPAPMYNVTDTTGGVTLADIESSLRTVEPSTLDVQPEGGETIKFTLETRRGKAKDYRYLKYNNRTSQREVREDNEIVRALQSFSGGFFNGLSGVADKFSSMVVEAPEEKESVVAAKQAEDTLKAEIAAEEAELARELAELRATRAAAVESAAAKALADERAVAQALRESKGESEASEAETPEEDGEAARLDKLKAKALEAARAKVATRKEANTADKKAKRAGAAAMAQIERAEPVLAKQEARVFPRDTAQPQEEKPQEEQEQPATKSTWRWFEKKE